MLMLVPEYEDDNFMFEYMAAEMLIAESPSEPSDGDDDTPIGDLLKKGKSIPEMHPLEGMTPTWSEERRQSYVACASPHIERYKITVDKINRVAMSTYNSQTDSYLATNLGIGGFKELFNSFLSDASISVKWSSKTATNAVRGVFWVTFTYNTYKYLSLRADATESEKQEFIAETKYFFNRINDCTKKHPYVMWRVITPQEQYFEQTFFNGHFVVHPTGRRFPTNNKWVYIPNNYGNDIFKGVKLLPDKKTATPPFK